MTVTEAFYLSIDPSTDVLASLQICHLSLAHVGEDPLLWKGVIIAFHSALQGAIAAHLTGTHGTGALVKKDAEQLSVALHDRDCPYPKKTRLADPGTLWKRMRREDLRVPDTNSGGGIVPTQYQTRAFKKLKDCRNDLTHFEVSGWFINLSGLPKILAELCDILDQIDKNGWAFRHLENSQRKRLRDLIQEIPKQALAIGAIEAP